METKKKSKAGYIILFVILYVIVAILMIKTELSWGSHIDNEVNLDEMTVRVSAEDYEKLRIGMTYSEVCEIVGGEGELKTQFGDMNYGLMYYVWPGKFHDKSVMRSELKVAFGRDSGRAEIIRESNLLHGKEIYKNIKENKKAEVKKAATEIASAIKKEMSYEEVVKIIGAEGILESSESSIDIDSGRGEEKKYVWDCMENEYTGMRLWIYFRNNTVSNVE